ncbi:BAG domain-containing protein [Histoplasma capsulatum var. duboisii H88]|uniref:BAG domain-containing protein n=1 Tax=Ajellomyces capsulatus (strain H88) TaxID=544711 RepID=F0U8W9_AJEC8|nr:BAG domain-containing protein [Histoplasma capsulatum var. duboisii H88]QSS52593.1 BAG domain-containing protein [Histoplasma capsulatum var. duboisii H88]
MHHQSPAYLSSIWHNRSMIFVSSHFSSISATSASYLESLAPHLPNPLRSVLSHFAIKLAKADLTSSPFLWLDNLAKPFESLSLLTSSTPTTRLAVTVLAALLLAVIVAMTWNPWRERSSPYRNTSPPTVTNEDYSYVTVDDADYTSARHNLGYSSADPQSGRHPLTVADDESEPDVIILKYRGKTYRLNFPAYSIGDGLTTVGSVKLAAANALDVADTRQIKLLYKGRVLRDDSARARDVGLKQNSATMCVVSNILPETSSEESLVTPAYYETSEAAEQSSSPPRANGASGGGGRKKRRQKKRKNNNDDKNKNASNDTQASAQSTSKPFAIPIERHHQQHPQRAPQQQQSPPSSYTSNSPNLSAPPSVAASTDYRPTSSASASASPRPSRVPKPSPNLNFVGAPQEKLSLLSSYFHDSLEPLLREFIQHPPGDQKTRDVEHRKLSETTMMQVILKVDGIEVDGNEEARQQRKTLIVTVQNLLKLLDEAHRRG